MGLHIVHSKATRKIIGGGGLLFLSFLFFFFCSLFNGDHLSFGSTVFTSLNLNRFSIQGRHLKENTLLSGVKSFLLEFQSDPLFQFGLSIDLDENNSTIFVFASLLDCEHLTPQELLLSEQLKSCEAKLHLEGLCHQRKSTGSHTITSHY